MFPILKEIEQWFGSDSLDQLAIRIGQKTAMFFGREEVGRLVEREAAEINRVFRIQMSQSKQRVII